MQQNILYYMSANVRVCKKFLLLTTLRVVKKTTRYAISCMIALELRVNNYEAARSSSF